MILNSEIILENGILSNAKKPKAQSDSTPFMVEDELVNENSEIRFFVFCAIRFIWCEVGANFKRLTALDVGESINKLQSDYATGLTTTEREERRTKFGSNSIEIEVPSYVKLLVEEVLNPFYVFQIFSIVLWAAEEYYYYAVAIFIITVLSITVSLKKTKQQSQVLYMKQMIIK